MKVEYIGHNDIYPCYKDKNGKMYFDINDGHGDLDLHTGAYETVCGEICGEPNKRVTEPVECDNPFIRHPREFDYMMLSRMMSDCNYFLGNGNGYEGHLMYGSVEKICDEMERLWKSFSDKDKPEWLSLEQIKRYRERMLKARRG